MFHISILIPDDFFDPACSQAKPSNWCIPCSLWILSVGAEDLPGTDGFTRFCTCMQGTVLCRDFISLNFTLASRKGCTAAHCSPCVDPLMDFYSCVQTVALLLCHLAQQPCHLKTKIHNPAGSQD